MKIAPEPMLKATPQDLYTGIHPREATEEELWRGFPAHIDGPRPSGCPALDRFTALVHRYLHHYSIDMLAQELRVHPDDLTGLVRALTGLRPEDWREEYITLVVRDMQREGARVTQIMERTGYSRNGLHRLMVRQNLPRRTWRY